MDTVPYLLLAGKELTIGDYRDSLITRILSNTQFSLATAKASSNEDKSVRVALGLQITVFNLGDPRMDKELDEGFKRVYKKQPPYPHFSPPPAGTPDDEVDRIKAKYRKELQEWANAFETDFDKEREAARKRNWNRSSWIIGIAPSWISEDGSLNSLSWDGGGVWTTAAYGFEGVKVLENAAQL